MLCKKEKPKKYHCIFFKTSMIQVCVPVGSQWSMGLEKVGYDLATEQQKAPKFLSFW